MRHDRADDHNVRERQIVAVGMIVTIRRRNRQSRIRLRSVIVSELGDDWLISFVLGTDSPISLESGTDRLISLEFITEFFTG